MKKPKDSLVKTIFHYSSSNLYRRLLGIINVLIKPKLLSPELYGLWNIINLIPRYAVNLHLGTRESMRYAIPYHQGRNEKEIIDQIRGSVFFGTFYIYAFAVAALSLFALFANLDNSVRIGLLIMSMVVMLQWYVSYYGSLLKAYQNFSIITTANYIYATLTVFLGLTLIYFFNIYGCYYTLLICDLIIVIYLRRKFPLHKQRPFKMAVFTPLVRKGISIMTFGFTFLLIQTADRLVLALYLGTEQVGYYAIALMVLNAFLQIPFASRDILEPRLMKDLPQKSIEINMQEYVFKPLINSAYYLPFLIGPVFFIFPIVISLFLPRYIPGILPTQVLITGGYFLALAFLLRGFIIANKWHLKVLKILFPILGLNICLIIIFIKIGLGLVGAALASSIANFLLFILLLLFIINMSHIKTPVWKPHVKALIWPFPFMCLVIAILEILFQYFPIHDFLEALLKLALFYGCIYFMIRIAHKRIALLKGFRLPEKSQIEIHQSED